MAELDAILQPEEYRHVEAPEWVFLPNLRLLLGWGPGLWETLGDRMSAVRSMFVILNKRRPGLEEMEGFFRWLVRYDADRPPMPFYARFLDDGTCGTLRANDICRHFAGPDSHKLHDPACGHPIEANENYRVTHHVSEDQILSLVVEKRTKSLKPEFQAKMGEFGLAHARGTGRRAERKPADQKRVRRQRDGSEQAFAEYLDGLKAEYRAVHVLELLGEPASRPHRFLIRMAELERGRLEAVARGKNDNDGVPYRPYEADELLLETCHSIASAEATDLAFDYAWKPVLRFDWTGLAAL